jgi:hypothetical protein
MNEEIHTTQDPMATVQDLNDRLDKVEEFYLPDIIEHNGEPIATVTTSKPNLDPGALSVRGYRKVVLVESSEKKLAGVLLDGMILTMFVLSIAILYNSLVWSIWS